MAVKRVLTTVALAAAIAASPAIILAQSSSWDAGVEHYNQKQFRQAITEFQKVAQTNPEFANTYYYIGMSHFRIKEYTRAIVSLNKYLELSEKGGSKADPTARAALGRAYLFAEDFPKAVSVLSVVTQTVTDDPINFYYLGVAHQKLNNPDKAIDAFSAALKLSPKDAITLDQLTRLLLSRAFQTNAKTDYQAAIKRAEELRLVRDDADSATLLGSAYLGAGEFAKAAVHFDRVVKANPQDGNGWFNYGLSLSRSEQFAKAETALQKATTLLPDNGNVFAELGFVQESLKKYKEALAAYEKANQLAPNPVLQESIDRVRGVAGA